MTPPNDASTMQNDETKASRISALPTELQEQIFFLLSNAEIFPFLFSRYTQKAALHTLWRCISILDSKPPKDKVDKMFRGITSFAWHLRHTREFTLVLRERPSIEHHSVVSAMTGLRRFELVDDYDRKENRSCACVNFILSPSVREVITNRVDNLRWATEEGCGLDSLTLRANHRPNGDVRLRPNKGERRTCMWNNVRNFTLETDQTKCDTTKPSHWNCGWGDAALRVFCEFVGQLAETSASAASLESLRFEAPGLIRLPAIEKVRVSRVHTYRPSLFFARLGLTVNQGS